MIITEKTYVLSQEQKRGTATTTKGRRNIRMELNGMRHDSSSRNVKVD